MTVPEENRPRTHTTDDLLESRGETTPSSTGGSGRTLREAFEEADVSPDDFAEE
ncbi:hypothetical protein ABZ896_18925 [Streptomyces sp. NPDC047072]|uniref:hypothetical protein n=1 Tax=Streptomyces sp. NPDC047072 TaxID=3154809 RepID=UPI0033D8D76D